ncbi:MULTISPECIES: diiron oxygenase [Streptomyces]|uniref:AurF N-oxygenase family protein n=1 Tax=Streptomyces TaxID=1883 RepID=UPI0003661F41|nr:MULTISPECIES: diiron oxygenase [unclassified Streptomyces]WSX94618.1 diiron oxygenase [Streptomyces sp. NBC_00891]WSY09097.1 diiron oxygenase [Streptomyces sp. NBC_00890]WSZ10718.1 diiron oxygenase [Streptomyces sp. NBC_00869]WSZ21778.1 diiron oxygenase [Streptomyces sp. NBC_00870]MYS35942.1 diiron oxygenase [Streptomyces sp. SID4920]
MASSTVRPEDQDRAAEQDVARRLLDSSAKLSYDPATEVDWDTPLDTDHHGASPEWSTLYATAYWGELTEAQRKALTRQEAASVASTGIWFEMILQQMVLRDMYAKDPTDPRFQWALTEVADECRHSIMFARGAAKLGAPAYRPRRPVVELGRAFKTLAFGEAAYAAILVAEEVLDVMQRDWMRDERVAPFVRTINNIHVVEESRHMKFARDETRKRLRGAGPVRRHLNALVVAIASYYIVTSMVNRDVYANAGLDAARARAEAKTNEHHKSLMRSSCSGLMEFLASARLLTKPALFFYKRADLI